MERGRGMEIERERERVEGREGERWKYRERRSEGLVDRESKW